MKLVKEEPIFKSKFVLRHIRLILGVTQYLLLHGEKLYVQTNPSITGRLLPLCLQTSYVRSTPLLHFLDSYTINERTIKDYSYCCIPANVFK